MGRAEPRQSPSSGLPFSAKEFGEAAKWAVEAWHEKNDLLEFEGELDRYRDELIHVASVAVAAIEALDRMAKR